jgi:putative DNA primase/helicase
MSERPPKPEVAPPVWENIPPELAERRQWVLWKFEWPEPKPGKPAPKKWAKVPYYVSGGRRTGDQGSDRDRGRLVTLEIARKAFEVGAWDGVGFGFLPGDGLVGIDIDAAIDTETGEVSQRCLGIVGSCLSTFTELSPSGTGCHIIGYGVAERSAKSNDIGVEMFCGSQFFTVTGRLWAGRSPQLGEIPPMVIEGINAIVARAKEERRAAAAAASATSRAPAPAAPARQPQRETPEQLRARVQAALDFLSSDCDYTDWISIGWALRDAFGDDAFSMWDAWSAKGGTYPGEADLRSHWRSFTASGKAPDDVVAVIFARARDAGWKPPRARQPKASRATFSAPAGGEVQPPAGGGAPPDEGPPDDPEPPDDDDGPDLILHRGKPIDCRENVLYCLRGDPVLAGLVKLNTFTELHERSRETPWERGPGEWDEEDDLMLGEYLLRRWKLLVKATSSLRQGVLMAAREHKYNPIVDLIRSEKWDGTERLDHWLTDTFDIEERPYTRLIGRCYIKGMVARAMRPGCKFDYMLILKGDQGLRKSAAFRVLAEPWFTDNAIKVGDKDSMMAMQLVWIAESAELESLNKAETTAVKQFLSAQEDMYRPPYGAQIKKRPRHTVMGGTTNAETFLKDVTGDRRFWPLEVKAVNLDVLRNMRLQLFAEALHRLKAGEQFWPTREQEQELIFPEQERFKKEERWEDYLDAYVNADVLDDKDDPTGATKRCNRDFFTTMELYGKALGIKAERIDGTGQMDVRISNAMKVLGFVKHRQTTGTQRLRGWLRKPKESAAPAASPDPAPAAMPALAPGAEDDDLPF